MDRCSILKIVTNPKHYSKEIIMSFLGAKDMIGLKDMYGNHVLLKYLSTNILDIVFKEQYSNIIYRKIFKQHDNTYLQTHMVTTPL